MADADPSLHRAGRGFLWLTAAKLHFMVAGWAIYFVLPRLMTEVDWGRFLVVLFLVSILNNVMVSSAVQGVSRFTASAPSPVAAWATLRGGLGLFLVLGGLGAGALIAGAPLIARAHADPGLAPLYQIAAPIAFGYALYAACVGSLNGRQRFGTQAAFDATYATLRLGLMIAAAVVAGRAFAARGAHAGYSLSALLICGIALGVVALPLWRQARAGSGEAGAPAADHAGAGPVGATPWRAMVLFLLPLALHQLGLNLLMRTDPLLLKALGGRVVADAPSVADAASVLAGRYGTAQVFALVPYQALVALSMVVFPLMADAAAADRRDALRKTAAGALRFALLFGAGLAAVLAARPADIIDLVYPASYRPGGLALQFLAWGVVGLSLITLCCAMLNAAGRTGRVLALTFGTFGAQAVVVVAVIHGVDTPEQALRYTALAAAGVLLAGAGVAMLTLRRTFGVALPLATLARVAPAAALASLAGMALPGRGTLVTLAASALVPVVYLTLLGLTRELTGADLARILGILRRRRG